MDIKETKELVLAIATMTNVVFDSLKDDGKIGLSDLPRLIVVFPKLLSAMEGANKIPAELNDISLEEKNELILAVKNELDQPENVELIVERCLNIAFELKELVKLF